MTIPRGHPKGRKFSEEHIENLRKSHLGKRFSEATKVKMSEKKKGKLPKNWHPELGFKKKQKNPMFRAGEKHWSWKGGITPLVKAIRQCFEYRQWRSDIFLKDNFICQKCGIKSELETDHYPKKFSEIINEYKIKSLEEALNCEELWSVNNGRTLCRNCHIKEKKQIL